MKPQKQNTAKQQREAEHKLYQAIVAINTVEEASAFLKDLCTPAEIQALTDRWRVVDLVKQSYSYRQIYEMTGVSVTTVGRVARYLSLGAGGYELIYERLKK